MRVPAWVGWLFLAPTLLVLSLFVLYPAVRSVYLSFHEVDSFSSQVFFIGIENYIDMFSSADYWQSLRVSSLFMIYTVVPSVILALLIAVGLDSNPYIQGFFRNVFLMPVAISTAMAAMLWIFIYNPTAGYLNYTLSQLGLPAPNWLGDMDMALISVAIATVWKEVGFNIIFFLAGLAGIPPELKEAARIDGASAFQRFRHVVLPLLSPTIFFVVVVSVIHSFDSFGQIHILTRGGPAGHTNVLVYSLFREGFENFRTGFASAQAVVLFAIILVITAVQFYVSKKRIHYTN